MDEETLRAFSPRTLVHMIEDTVECDDLPFARRLTGELGRQEG